MFTIFAKSAIQIQTERKTYNFQGNQSPFMATLYHLFSFSILLFETLQPDMGAVSLIFLRNLKKKHDNSRKKASVQDDLIVKIQLKKTGLLHKSHIFVPFTNFSYFVSTQKKKLVKIH